MDIEDLSKSQLLLLTILVNFVVSIATGILTVSLLDQAPTTVTQTVNRIVDHTIETVATQVPVVGKPAPSSEDLLTSAVADYGARAVTVSYLAGATSPTLPGVYLSKEHAVLSASAELPDHVTVTFADGSSLPASKSAEDGPLKKFVFAPDAKFPNAPADTFADMGKMKQGQTVIGITGEGKAVTGIISKIGTGALYADIPQLPAGSALINLSGDIVGVALPDGTYALPDRLAALAAPSQ